MFDIASKIGDIIKDLIASIWVWIVGPFKQLKSFETLIYGKDGDSELAFGVFTADELKNIFEPGLNAFYALTVGTILIGIIFWGMRISSSGINPGNRTRIIEFLFDVFIVALCLYHLPLIYQLIFGTNYMIVDLFDAAKDGTLIQLEDVVEANDDVLGNLIIALFMLGLWIWANFYYMMRKLTLIILMIAGPLMIAFYMIPQTRGLTFAWIKELIGTVFVQAIHACLFFIVSIISGGTQGIEAIILYMVFIPTSEAIKSLLGMGGNLNTTMNKAGAAFGMSSLSAMYGAVKGAISDKSVMGALKGAGSNITKGKSDQNNDSDDLRKSTIASNTGTDSGSTSKAERMLKAGDFMSKGGKAVFGMAGAIAGSPMGPGGSIAGSTIGFVAGGVAGGLAGRTGAAIGQLGANSLAKGVKAGIKGANETWNSSKLADEKLADDLAENETTAWASNNREDFNKQSRKKFPDADEHALNNMWDEKLNSKRSEFRKKAQEQVGEIRKNDGKIASAEALASVAAKSLLGNWSQNNKEEFNRQFDEENSLSADSTREEKEAHDSKRKAAWENALNNKNVQYKDLATSEAQRLSGSKDISDKFINKNDYTKSLSNKAMELDKASFAKAYKEKNPNATEEDINSSYEEQNEGSRSHLNRLQNATRGIKAEKLYKGTGVNMDYLASQLAASKTDKDKQKFMSDYESEFGTAAAGELINSSAQALTNNWAKQNEAAFKNDYDARNPLSNSANPLEKKAHEDERNTAWKKELSKQKGRYTELASKAATSLAGNTPIKDAKISKHEFSTAIAEDAFNDDESRYINSKHNGREAFAKENGALSDYKALSKEALLSPSLQNSGEIVNGAVIALTKKWSDANKKQFNAAFDKSNPLPTNATELEIKQHDQNREQSWKQSVEVQRERYQGIANSAAVKLGANGGNDQVDGNQFSDLVAVGALKLDRKAFNANFMKMNPGASSDEVSKAFFNQHGDKSSYLGQMTAGQEGKTTDLIQTSADAFTKSWAQSNKAQFIQAYDQQNPIGVNASQNEIKSHETNRNQAWARTVDSQRAHYIGVAENVGRRMGNGAGALINKGDFATQMASDAYQADSQIFASKANGTSFVTQSGGKEQYKAIASDAVQEIPTLNGSSNELNTAWENQKGQVYKSNLTQVREQLSGNQFTLNRPIQPQNKVVRGISSLSVGAAEGVVASTGLPEVSKFISESKVGVGVSSTISSIGNNFERSGKLSGIVSNTLDRGASGFVDSTISPIISGAKDGIATAQSHVVPNVIGKQSGFRNASSYFSGIVGGVSGYQRGARFGMKVNPYNSAVSQQTNEISEIQQLAQKVQHEDGSQSIAKGAIQLVTTANESFIQARDHTGHTRKVSRNGTGDSSMKHGEIVYQDLNIQDGTLLNDSNPYRLDSGGAKVSTNRILNINPNRLVSNRNTPENPRTVQEIQTFNQQVDAGQFYLQDLNSHNLSQPRMVIDRNRSYLVASDNDGIEYRVSPYSQGDARLLDNQIVYRNCEIRNKRIVQIDQPYTKNENSIREFEHNISIEPNSLLGHKPNKRLEARKKFERARQNSIGGAI